VVRHDSEEFQGLLAKLSHFVESDLPRAIAKLEQIAVALEKYATVTTRSTATSSPVSANAIPSRNVETN
jgi:hypothetical protein